MPEHQPDLSLWASALGLLIFTGTAAQAASVVVDFDTLPDGTAIAAPVLISATVPLREQLAAAGVHFMGGGGILSGDFGVSGFSAPNFLGFNSLAAARYSDGSLAAPPEQIRFDQPPDLVRVNVASAGGGTATLTALDAAGNTVASAQLALGVLVAPLTVQSSDYNIASVQFTFTGTRTAVVDDLVYVVRDRQNAPPVTFCALAGPAGANGWYLGDVHATLTAQDADGTVVSTRFKLDGGDWQPYSAPVLISGEGTHSLQYQSLDNEGAWENVQTASVKIDVTSPVVDLRLSRWFLWPPKGQMMPVVVNGSATDTGSGIAGVKFEVKDEYGEVQPALAAFGQTIQLKASYRPKDRDGRYYQVTATATDNAGRATSASRWVLVPRHLQHERNERAIVKGKPKHHR